MTIRVLVVDDEDLVRNGLRLIPESEPDLAVVGAAVDGADALERAAALQPDVVLMDVRMPRMDGRGGASGFLLEHVPAVQLVHAIRVAAAGEALLAPSVTRRLIARFAVSPPPAATVT